jgi:hypothetical protein
MTATAVYRPLDGPIGAAVRDRWCELTGLRAPGDEWLRIVGALTARGLISGDGPVAGAAWDAPDVAAQAALRARYTQIAILTGAVYWRSITTGTALAEPTPSARTGAQTAVTPSLGTEIALRFVLGVAQEQVEAHRVESAAEQLAAVMRHRIIGVFDTSRAALAAVADLIALPVFAAAVQSSVVAVDDAIADYLLRCDPRLAGAGIEVTQVERPTPLSSPWLLCRTHTLPTPGPGTGTIGG